MTCQDNAGTEVPFGSLKVERLHGMRFETRRSAEDEGLDGLVWHDSRKLHSTLGSTTSHGAVPSLPLRPWQANFRRTC